MRQSGRDSQACIRATSLAGGAGSSSSRSLAVKTATTLEYDKKVTRTKVASRANLLGFENPRSRGRLLLKNRKVDSVDRTRPLTGRCFQLSVEAFPASRLRSRP